MVPIAFPTCGAEVLHELAMSLEKWPLLLVTNEQVDADWGHCSHLSDTWQGPENEVNICMKRPTEPY